jgi:hypothetical protein
MKYACCAIIAMSLLLLAHEPIRGGDPPNTNNSPTISFHTSTRCMACHNGLTSSKGEDISIGLDWRSSIMANSSRDPYWQASARRESIDHPEAKAEVEDECSVCHMPITRYVAMEHGQKGKIFDFLPFSEKSSELDQLGQDGVTCSVCHQISNRNLGTKQSYSGGFLINPPQSPDDHPEYGPYVIQPGQKLIMQSSTGGFRPTYATHISESALCASCHTLFTTARGAGGKAIGQLPEQMPYLEWLHSDYAGKQSCQSCHMTEVQGPAPIAAVLGVDRLGMKRHVFVGGNFFMQRVLNNYRDELTVAATPKELTEAAANTAHFLQTQSAQVKIENAVMDGNQLSAEVVVKNLTGHKMPTAFPSRRAWLHFVVLDRNGKTIFESGALNADGSIVGNDNDADPGKYEPYYSRITTPDQVEIYEDILGDSEGHVTTGLLDGVAYLKDDRLLPYGFDKATADHNIAVVGGAASDPNFSGQGSRVQYSIPVGNAEGPFQIQVELLYQPIGYRWAHNLAPYKTPETNRLIDYYDSMSTTTGIVLAHAEVTH